MNASADAASRPRGRPRDPSVDEDILGAAVALLSEGGFERLSMEAVACRAGVAKATIYRRFPSKVDLIVAMCQAFTPPVAHHEDTGSLRTDLLDLVGFLGETLGASDTGKLMPSMLSAAKENPEVREALAQFSASRRTRIYDIVRAGIERGELPPGTDADLMGDILVGAIMYRILLRNRKVDRKFSNGLVDRVIAGFGLPADS